MGELFLTATEVMNYVGSFFLSRAGFMENSHIFDDIIKELKDRAADHYNIEQEAYHLLKCNDLLDLQKKIDVINKDLIGFSNEYLRQGQVSKLDSYVSQEELVAALKTAILQDEKILEQIESDSIEDIGDIGIDILSKTLAEYIAQGRTSNESKHKDRKVDLYYVKMTTNKFINALKGEKGKVFGKAYKKDLILYLQNIENINLNNGQSTWEIGLETGEFPQLSEDILIFPYMNLSQEEVKIATDISGGQGKEVWDKFCSSIKDYIRSKGEVTKVLTDDVVQGILDDLGVDFFVQKGFNNVLGAMGELQARFISVYLYGEDTGIYNIGSKDLSADIVLQDLKRETGYGVQVKNYHGWGGGYHLKSKDIKFETLISRSGGEAGMEALGQFLAARFFNKPIPKATQEYKDFYNKTLKAKKNSRQASINAYLASHMDLFFGETTSVDDLKKAIAGGEFYEDVTNAFYLFEGKTVIPYSKIYALLARRVERIKKELSNIDNEKFSMGNFFIGYGPYSRPFWEPAFDPREEERIKYTKSKEQKNPPSFNEVMSAISLHASLNLYLDDLELDKA